MAFEKKARGNRQEAKVLARFPIALINSKDEWHDKVMAIARPKGIALLILILILLLLLKKSPFSTRVEYISKILNKNKDFATFSVDGILWVKTLFSKGTFYHVPILRCLYLLRTGR